MKNNLLYTISPKEYREEELLQLLKEHPEIQYVSLMGVDLAGNDTDEKIPINVFLEKYSDFFSGQAVQTDGSSVVLDGIAVLNNAKVDIVADSNVLWRIDYNYENIDIETGRPVGSLKIPSFLRYQDRLVDSRAVLKSTLDYVKKELMTLLNGKKIEGIDGDTLGEIVDLSFTIGTELEFWVKTPMEKANTEVLTASQIMKEQYWQRTRGEVRTALEQALHSLKQYGLKPEMGHKEVGGVKSQMELDGSYTHVMEQLEIVCRFDVGLQAVDNELITRRIIKEVFRRNGLEVTFQAKPIFGVAGSGEHTHVGIVAELKTGEKINLFAPSDRQNNFLSSIGYGAIMGFLKNYEVINPFISATNDSFNRLKPGFEAPVCIVTSLGHTPALPTRNRTVLVALVRDVNSPLSYRFEVRSPNPFTNTFLAVSAIYLTMLDGIRYSVESGKTTQELEKELNKEAENAGDYLEVNRSYRSEKDVFDDFSAEERNRLFGKPPATVWENMENLSHFPEKRKVLEEGATLTEEIINAFLAGALRRWKNEILTVLIPDGLEVVRSCVQVHEDEEATNLDIKLWQEIQQRRLYLAKDSIDEKSLLTRLEKAIKAGEYSLASELQLEMSRSLEELNDLYLHHYLRNLI